MTRYAFTKIVFGAVILLVFTGCSQDCPETVANTLPEGKYPLEISDVILAHDSQSRVSENSDGNSSTWDWDGTEKIGVQLYVGEGNSTFTLNTDKSLTSDKPTYWKDTKLTNVTAWYPVDSKINLVDQSVKLAYIFKGSGSGKYNAPVSLNFTHSLAKLRIIPTGSGCDLIEDIKIKSYTSCTHTKGENLQGSNEGWITMMKCTRNGETHWEANVVPDYEISYILVNDYVELELNTSFIPAAQKINTITLTMGMPI